MIGLLLIAAGIFILIKGRIGVDEKRYLQRPKSTYVGIVLIILGLLPDFNVSIFLVLMLFVVTVIVAYFIANKTDVASAQGKEKQVGSKSEV